MNSKLRLLALILLAVTAPLARGDLLVQVQPVAGGEGGYRAQPNDQFQWILAYYASGTSKQPEPRGHASFGIFSLTAGNTILNPSETYQVAIKQQLRSGGETGVTAATAFLYESYATGNLGRWLSGFSYDAHSAATLQRAVWALENGEPQLLPNTVSDLLMAHFGSWTQARESYAGSAIRVVTLTPVSGGPSSEHLIHLPDAYEPRMHGAPAIGYRQGIGGNDGNTPPPFVIEPPVTNPPVVEPPPPGFEDIDDIVTPPPTTDKPQDDFTGSTPPGTPGTPQDPSNPTTNPPTTNPPTTNPPGEFPQDNQPPVSVPDNGFTAILLAGALGLLAAGRRALRK